EPGQIDQPALAETLLDLLEQAVIDRVVLVEAAAEIIDELFVEVAERRLTPLGNGIDHLGGDAGLTGEASMGLPFELCAPITRGHQDRDFGQPRRKVGAEPNMSAELVGMVGEPGAVQPNMRRRRHRVTWSRHHVVPHPPLRLVQLVALELSVSLHCRLQGSAWLNGIAAAPSRTAIASSA